MTTRVLARPADAIADLLALTKPRLSGLVLFTTAGAFLLAPGPPDLVRLAWTLAGTWMTVASSHALNMFAERDVDALMARTRDRPLPSGRLDPSVALWLGVALGTAGVPLLALSVGPAAALLAALALGTYVLAYTPLKVRSPAALYVGAVSGAIPPVLGWAAATGEVGLPALALGATLFVWQIPHFLGLALLLADEYAGAGVRVLPVVAGPAVTRRYVRVHAIALLPTSLLVPWAGAGGVGYAVAAPTMGLLLVAVTLLSPDRTPGGYPIWGRRVFLASLVHITVLFAALGLDSLVR